MGEISEILGDISEKYMWFRKKIKVKNSQTLFWEGAHAKD